MTTRFLVGDVFERMGGLPDGSVDLVMTSPPFLALRSYLPAGHPDKALEIGGEATPAEFIDTLLALTAEWRRLLAPHGSICVELGDTYSGSGGAGGDYAAGGLRDGQAAFGGSGKHARRAVDGWAGHPLPNGFKGGGPGGAGWPLEKSLTGIPTLYAWSLAYGRNLLTGEPSPAGMWRIRNVVAWVRPNPPVGALGDKFRPATSYLTCATVARDRWFDLDAVRTPGSGYTRKPGAARATPPGQKARGCEDTVNPAGAPPLDWWEIPPGGYSGAHYAVMPPAVAERPIQAMCPRRVCRTCGAPSRRITAKSPEYEAARAAIAAGDSASVSGRSDVAVGNKGIGFGHGGGAASLISNGKVDPTPITVGWTTCGCPGADGIRLDGFHTGTGWRPGLVLDPFGGSGTTGLVAMSHSRDAVLIDLDERNAWLARERIGMFLEVDVPAAEVPA